eukprot:132187-Rhodomonas_salina.3
MRALTWSRAGSRLTRRNPSTVSPTIWIHRSAADARPASLLAASTTCSCTCTAVQFDTAAAPIASRTVARRWCVPAGNTPEWCPTKLHGVQLPASAPNRNCSGRSSATHSAQLVTTSCAYATATRGAVQHRPPEGPCPIRKCTVASPARSPSRHRTRTANAPPDPTTALMRALARLSTRFGLFQPVSTASSGSKPPDASC